MAVPGGSGLSGFLIFDEAFAEGVAMDAEFAGSPGEVVIIAIDDGGDELLFEFLDSFVKEYPVVDHLLDEGFEFGFHVNLKSPYIPDEGRQPASERDDPVKNKMAESDCCVWQIRSGQQPEGFEIFSACGIDYLRG